MKIYPQEETSGSALDTSRSVLVINDTRVDQHNGCSSVMGAIAALLERNGLGPVFYWPAHAELRGVAKFDAALRAAKLVVINGEGTIHHDRSAGRRLLEAGRLARQSGVPVALINAAWEGNGTEFTRMLKHFDLLAARDSRSAMFMAEGGAEVRVVPDLSLWHAQAQAPRPVATARAGIGFTDNVDRFKSLELERLRRACGGETLSIGHGSAGVGGWARFLRAGVAIREDCRSPMRLAALLQLRHRLWRRGSADTGLFMARIASLELLVSGRFHACTLAFANGTPVVAQSSNTGKISALFHDAGLEPWRGNLTLGPAAVQGARARGWSEAERAALAAYLSRALTAAEELFFDLARLAGR
jgi:hypothetical protein